MRNPGFVFAAAVLLAAVSGSAAAQNQTSPSNEAIVVQGTRVGEKQIRDFVKAATDVPFDGQLGRFDVPACPVALGLMPVHAAAVVERMRRVAAAAKVPVAPPGCKPNVIVIIASDKRAAIEDLDRRFPAYFSQMSDAEVRGLASSPAPAVAWQISRRLSADGQVLNMPVGFDYYVVQGTFNPSRLHASSKPSFVAAVLVVDLEAAGGLTTTELADYAAMRTLVATDPERVVKIGAPTILGVLAQPDDRLLPVTLTSWDFGLLKAIYSTDNSAYARYQRGDIDQVVRQELQKSGTEQPQ
jgi:hypothetical protein